MAAVFFVVALALLMGIVLKWGFKTLPQEKWQMVAAFPLEKLDQGQWRGLNLTWYGLLSANAYTFGVIMVVILAASAGVPISVLVLLTVLMLAVTIPSSKIIARIVEKKKGTLTVGGAVFAGVITAPWIIMLLNATLGTAFNFHVPVAVMMAVLSIGYTFGESLGRLACLSFGCCYGKPLSQCSEYTRKMFENFNVVFTGDTKKAAYASNLAGEALIPIQIITAVIYAVSGLAGTLLFLKGFAGTALVETLVVTQVWRVVSEFFRADFRGERKFSMYQIMALSAIVYTIALLAFFPDPEVVVSLDKGFKALWHPGMILFFQGVWVISFLHAGRSSVTASKICFHVVKENI
ncbi:prolipoprotein diacylglyceryl transferase family protein [uncultured Desulfobacter sp.]|uniref:prolipoprotein diacylglyceryl transferase family protein n=1 Tax=uncultured Desulfobacter sp. TaxID=240139 RepID=UPI002AAAC653|nr:prolipoprotein diacylglyceryl transferase family protein [uncultured Desulfobacter sp.]